MSHLTDQRYLQTEQYKDASNLNARICLHQRFSTNDYRWQRWVFDRLDLPGRCDVLDVGCGPGDLWLENGDRIPPSWTILLSDLSPGMLQKARHDLGSSRHRFTYRILDVQAIPFADESFDAIIANHMLYHVPDLKRALTETHRVLRPGGQLYAATNGSGHLRELRDLVAKFCADADMANPAAGFGLENGAAQLSQHFGHVTRHRQENALVVTEAEPLIAYARSMMCQTVLRQNVEALGRAAREQITARGAIHVQKDSGLFKATKA
ncbi:MAG: class I SAM-dependent methyltransferase [Anaerolineae bacterium]